MAKAKIFSTYTRLHDPILGEQTLIQALELSREIGDRAAQVKLNWNLMLAYLFSSRLDQALIHGELALPLARELDDREPLAFVLNDLCRLYVCLGKFDEAHMVVQEAREMWRSMDNQTMLADSFGSEAEAYFNEGDHAHGLECAQQGLAISEKIENLWGKAYNRMLSSFIYLDMGEIGRAIQLSEEAIFEGDRGGLIASSTSQRAELGWFYGYYGAVEKGLDLADLALEITEAKQPDFRSFPLAIKVRLYLMKGDLETAEMTAGPAPLLPIKIPYSRYTIIVCLANVELALAQKNHERALTLADELLERAVPLTRIDIPYVMARKADALIGSGRLEEAHQVLTDACSLAEETGSRHHLWSTLASLAAVKSMLGRQAEVDEHRGKARLIVEEIAESLRPVGLSESFLNQTRVKELMR